MAPLTVSKLAERTGISPDTILDDERLGLLPAPVRTPAGYRQYDDAVADRVRLIKGAQRFGLRLREIGELLAVRDRGGCSCGHAEALVRRRIDQIDAEITRLADLREELARLADDCAAPSADLDGSWPSEVQFIDSAKEATAL
jgi:DNA-binding transcriptional MerR regulator